MSTPYSAFDATAKIVTSADGTHIYTDAVGDPSMPAILCLHGFSLSSVVYDNLFIDPTWKDNFYLIRYDIRGHGRSDKPEDDAAWQTERFAEDFLAVVAEYQVHQPFVMGWSYGGAVIADILTVCSSTFISGVIYIAPLPYLEVVPQIASSYAVEMLSNMSQTEDVNAFQIGVQGFVRAFVSPDNFLNPIAFPKRLQHACLGDAMSQPRVCASKSLGRTQSNTGVLRAGKDELPMLLITGKYDMLLASQPIQNVLVQWRGSRVVEMETGHMPWWEAPKEFNDVAIGWIKEVLSNGSKREEM
ncbi:hypothetical protein SERLA73DRAFT_183422, partial [Serpula lacrymans var. lacrymans S7.3]